MVAKTSFAPIYPVIAGQILEGTGICKGLCVDAGSGPGSLAIAIARISDLSVWSLDLSPHMTEIATENIREAGLSDRIRTINGDVQSLPFDDGSVDLVVSRGSVMFWKDKTAAFSEINRVLRPEGQAYIGGGFGTKELAEKIKRNPGEGRRGKGQRHGPPRDLNPENYHSALAAAGIRNYDLRRDDSGFWINIRKSPPDHEKEVHPDGAL